MEKKFKCKDEVIYRRTDERSEWTYGIFSHYYDYCNVKGVVVDGHFLLSTVHSILPYEGYEHLVGTTDEPYEEVRLEEGEYIMASDFKDGIKDGCCSSGRFIRIEGENFVKESYKDSELPYKYVVRFSDFNPNDMEETRKHILCVRDGRIIRYKD